MSCRWPVVGVCLMFTLGVGVAQEPSAPSPDSLPSFRSGIDIVELDVSVLGKDRMPIRGLTAADFTVLEDGKPQPVVRSMQSICRTSTEKARRGCATSRLTWPPTAATLSASSSS